MGEYGLRAEDGRAIVVIMAVLGVVSIASVALRIVSRRMRDLSLGLDDYLIMLAMVSQFLIRCTRAPTHRNLVFCDRIDSVGYYEYGPPIDCRFIE
jgi:hypothetical protein